MSQHFDFQKALEPKSVFEDFVVTKEKEIRDRINTKSTRSNTLSLWWFVLVLLLIALLCGGVYLGYKYISTQTSSKTKTTQVAKKTDSESIPSNIVSGDGFSLLLNTPTPEGFVSEKKTVEASAITGKIATNSSFNKTIGDQKYGLEVTTSGYDNKFDRDGYDLQVLKYLGTGSQLKDKNITLRKNITASKIVTENAPNITYYTIVTVNNYYLVKISRAPESSPNSSTTNKFIDELLASINLN